MKTNITFGGIIALVLIAILAYLFFAYRKDAQKLFKEKINPMSDKNVAYGAVNTIVQETTGDPNATLGTKLYEWVDGIKNFLPFLESEEERNQRLRAEFLEKRKISASGNSTQERVYNPPFSYGRQSPDIGIRFPNMPGDVFE